MERLNGAWHQPGSELVINLKMAEAIGDTIPPALFVLCRRGHRMGPLCNCSQPLLALILRAATMHRRLVLEEWRPAPGRGYTVVWLVIEHAA